MALGTVCELRVFRNARLKLTLTYTLVIALVMAAFSIALYLALSASMSSNLEVSENATPRVEQAILAAQLARARLALAGINVVGWVVAATASYVVAGRTLAPIESALTRQRQFTAHASHELRTPLTVIKGEIDVTQARQRTPEQYRQTLERIDAEVVHLETMVGDLLTLARMEAGKSQLERQRDNVSRIIRDVAEPFRSTVEAHQITLEVAVPTDLEAALDWSRIRHLLFNLIDNATRHTPAGGRIRVSSQHHGKSLEMSVFNSGSSIDADDLPHLFLPFYRGKGVIPDTGTGLGLALCDWIARTHGGSILVRNVSDGVSFDVRLPVD